jgi:ABC-type transport system involved in multi-copper enzyme maturation permease subunit
MHWGHAAVLTGLTVVLIGLAVVLFQRRDLRQTG